VTGIGLDKGGIVIRFSEKEESFLFQSVLVYPEKHSASY
jgi:hypothetical protein